MEGFQQKNFSAHSIFNNNFMCGKTLFMYCFNALPSSAYVGGTDGEKAFNSISEKYGALIKSVHGYRYHNAREGKCNFNETYMILTNNCIIEFDDNYCEIYHDGKQDEFLSDCISLMKGYKAKKRKRPLEINLIARSRTGLQLKGMEIKRTKLDLNLYYEDDFAETDSIITKRLNKEKDKGIVLLHGSPGTGKTTYLRYLIGKIKKKILFLSPGAAANIMDPDFIELLIDNPDCVLVIEDAENIIMDRKISNNASVSNLLNISDGLLADFLNVQIIYTFNNSLTLLDSALLRKGRLIAKYEFGKLGINKSQSLSDHLGYDKIINEPMTIAEITNPNEKDHVPERTQVMGFRRHEEMVN
jgi:energy-coupling factor transporter ATP-binding protein EcfA2